MKLTEIIFAIILLCFTSIVLTPQGDIAGKSEYKLYGFTKVTSDELLIEGPGHVTGDLTVDGTLDGGTF